MNEQGFTIEQIEPFQKTEEVTKFEFQTRASQDYILIKGKAELYCRHVKTGIEQRGTVVGPAVIKFYPFWYHEMKVLTDVTFIELGSVAEHRQDRKE